MDIQNCTRILKVSFTEISSRKVDLYLKKNSPEFLHEKRQGTAKRSVENRGMEPPRWLCVLALEFAEHFRQGDLLSGLAVLFRVLN